MTRAANPNTEVFDLSVAFTKDDGSPGKVQDGSITWSSDNNDIIVTATADGLAAVVSANANGAATISVDADGDLGEAVLKLHAEVQVVFSDTDVEATGVGITVGDPRPKDAAAPNDATVSAKKSKVN